MASNNKNSRVSKNNELYVTKQQQFHFEEFEDNLDDTFLLEYKNIKKEEKKKDSKQKEINKALSKELKKELKERKVKSDNKIYYQVISIILTFIVVLLILFLIYHFISFNHNKVKLKTVTKEVTVVDKNYLFLGDSITKQYDLEKYFPDEPVINSGISGNTAEDILNDMKKRVYDYNPSKIFFMIGINDLCEVNDFETEEVLNNIKEIITKIETNRPKAKIYIESVLPVNHDVENSKSKDRDYNRIIELNKKIKEYAKDKKIVYINLFDKLKNEEGILNEEYTKDGLHLNDKGYEILTEELKNYLE